ALPHARCVGSRLGACKVGHAGLGNCPPVRSSSSPIARAIKVSERRLGGFVEQALDLVRIESGRSLGLPINLHLARATHGHISAASEPGGGSSFTLWRPAAEGKSPADARPETVG